MSNGGEHLRPSPSAGSLSGRSSRVAGKAAIDMKSYSRSKVMNISAKQHDLSVSSLQCF